MLPFNNYFCNLFKGHDDATLDRLQGELAENMTKIKQDYNLVPHWLNCSRQMAPDFIVKDPKKSPVWEITGAEFSKAEIHTADGISIRFPRVTRIRDDKDWKTSTNLSQLKQLFETSKQSTDIDLEFENSDKELQAEKLLESTNMVTTPTKMKKEDETHRKVRHAENSSKVKSPTKIKKEDEDYSPECKKVKLDQTTSHDTPLNKGNIIVSLLFVG